MIKETITYIDYNGIERTEDFYFHLTEAELMKMEIGTKGGYTEMVQRIIKAQDQPAIIAVFEELIHHSYGVKTLDGRGFVKRAADLEAFISTEAYSKLFMKLATDDVAAARFINGVVPEHLAKNAQPVMLPNS